MTRDAIALRQKQEGGGSPALPAVRSVSMHHVEGAAAAILVVLTFGLFVAWLAMIRRPGRWSRYLSESFWIRAMRWIAALGAAAVVGSLAAGGGEVTAAILVFALAALGIVFLLWSQAKTFGRRD